MMGIYIKGMEMPKKCADCRFCHYEGHDAFCCKALKELVYDDGEVFKPWKKRLKNCPLVPVPAHGALMDRDDFFATCPELVDGYKHITDELVVIPAEEGE